MSDLFVKIMIAMQIGASLTYASGADWGRTLYWIGAIVITLSTLII